MVCGRPEEAEMIVALIVLAAVAWYATGATSFAYWWSKDYDVTTGDLPAVALLGIFGPLTFLMGWGIHGEHKTRVIKKRRS
jgi:hypothetical protein